MNKEEYQKKYNYYFIQNNYYTPLFKKEIKLLEIEYKKKFNQDIYYRRIF